MFKFLFLFVILSVPSFAYPDWIQQVLDKNQNVHYDMNASVVIYLNDCEILISDGLAESKYRKIVKILKEDAIFNNSFFSLPTNNFDNINDFDVWILRTDGSEENIDEDGLISLGAQQSSAYFDDEQLVFGILPRVGIGTIIAFEFEIDEEGETSYFQEFVFHDKQPVISSNLIVELPDYWDINYAGLGLKNIKHKRNKNVFTWWCNDLEYEADELLAPPDKFLQKKIMLGCFDKAENNENHFSAWDKVGSWCINYFLEPTRYNLSIKNITEEITKNCNSQKEKISAIADFVQNEIRYVAIEVGKNKWIPRNADITLTNRYGDCKDKSALMISMLGTIGIESYPVLVGSQKPIFIDLPSPYQFNHVIIAISTKNIENLEHLEKAVYKDCLLFDPTNPEIKLGELPISLYYSGAIIGSSNYPDFFYLDKTSPLDFMQMFECDASIDTIGNINAEIRLKYFNAFATTIEHTVKNFSAVELQEFFLELLGNDIPNIRIISLINEKKGDSLCINIQATSSDYVQKMEDTWVLKSQLLNLESLPVMKAIKRNFPIWLGGPKESRIKTSWKFPDNYSPVTISDSISSKIENALAEYNIEIKKNSAIVTGNTIYEGSLLDQDSYPNVIEYSKKIQQINNQVIVLRRTK